MILKDIRGYVIPTNTLELTIPRDRTDGYYENRHRAILKPGKVFKYVPSDTPDRENYNLYLTNAKLNTDINDNVKDFCFTNIFLMQISEDPNLIGFYLNTVNKTVSVESTYVNDLSFLQFAVNSFSIRRNAIGGENFYKISTTLQPSVINSELQKLLFLTPEELEEIDGIPIQIRAEFDGIVEGFKFLNQSVFMIVRYTPDIPGVKREDLIKYAQEPGMPTDEDNPDDLTIWIRISSPVTYNEVSGEKEYNTPSWYNTTLQAGDIFTKGSVIANRKPKDLGVLRVITELEGDTFGYYIPMTLEEYDEGSDVYTFSAYLSTDDIMNDDGRLEIIGGFSNIDGTDKELNKDGEVEGYRNLYVSIDPTECHATISTFIRYDDANYKHLYSNYDYLKTHTLTNSYKTTSESFDFLTPMKFIKSVAVWISFISSPPSTRIAISRFSY